MYCERCGYGSDYCKFQLHGWASFNETTGALVEVTVGKEGGPGDDPVYRCPQCGTVGAHLHKFPRGNERTRSIHPSRNPNNKKPSRPNDEFVHDSPHIALKAIDYSKNAPAV
jgi:uncharacterized Zn finger protein